MDPAPYLHKLATKYMQEKGLAVTGKKYTLDSLPRNYALFGKTRANEPTHVVAITASPVPFTNAVRLIDTSMVTPNTSLDQSKSSILISAT